MRFLQCTYVPYVWRSSYDLDDLPDLFLFHILLALLATSCA